MSRSETILLYGSPGHLSLRLLYERLRQRGVRQIVFIAQERYPGELGITLDSSGPQSGRISLGDRILALSDIVSVAVDNYYAAADPQLSEADRRYAQIEGWAALVALFYQLSHSCLVANLVCERDYLSCRWGELALLSAQGLGVPQVLVTSDAWEAEKFYGSLEGKVIYRPVAAPPGKPVIASLKAREKPD